MSAFIVGDTVINEVVHFLLTAERYKQPEFHAVMAKEFMIDMKNPAEVKSLADCMFNLNCDAVGCRYGEAAGLKAHHFTFKPVKAVTPVQAYKSLQCWLYQCAEGDIPETSLLYAAMKKVHDEIAHSIVSALPEYDKARW